MSYDSQERRQRLEAMLDADSKSKSQSSKKAKAPNTLDAPEEVLERRQRGRRRHQVVLTEANRREQKDSFVERIFLLIILALCIYGAVRLIMHLLNPS